MERLDLVLTFTFSGISTLLQRDEAVLDPVLMKAMGRWHSCSYELYMKDHAAASLLAEKAGEAVINAIIGDRYPPGFDPLYDDPPDMKKLKPLQPLKTARKQRKKK